jgi:hypothetical protein
LYHVREGFEHFTASGYNAITMPIIDQRILIPASQSQVWKYLSDLSRNADWQADCRSVTFLSSKREGPGTRWRMTTSRAQQLILEIQSWYNGLGYEYTIVDGTSMLDTKGRIRLQEIAEGTVVQWTFSFETKGVLGGLRGGTRQLENDMAASLKALYKQIKAMPKESAAVRSLMQDSPDVEGRQHYQPRYTPAFDARKSSTSTDPVAVPEAEQTVMRGPAVTVPDAPQAEPVPDLLAEPPIKPDDTKPNPILAPEAPADPAVFAPPAPAQPTVRATDSEPDFMPVLDDMLHQARPSQVETVALDAIQPMPAIQEETAPPPAVVSEPSEPEPPASMPPAEQPAAEQPPVVISEPPAPAPPLQPEPAVVPPVQVKSIWEELGLPRPENLEPSPLSGASSVSDPALMPLPPVTSIRQGFRAQDRRRIVRVRFPQ